MIKHEYPFDEFAADFDGSYDYMELQPDDFERNMAKLLGFMMERYPDPEVRQFRFVAFMRIVMYFGDHVHELDQGQYAVYGSPQVGALVSESVFRAVHKVFTASDRSRKEDPPPEEIMRLADMYKAQEAAQ